LAFGDINVSQVILASLVIGQDCHLSSACRA